MTAGALSTPLLVYVVDPPGEALRLVWTDETGRHHTRDLPLPHAANLLADLSRAVARRITTGG